MGKIKDRFDWLFSSHYKMERFGVTFVALMLCMATLLGTIFARKAALDKETLGNNVVYTTSFSTSLSGNKGQVLSVMCDDARTQAFILIKFEDMSTVITDAREYQIFLTGTNLHSTKETLLCAPAASIFMFGSTGYMGIYLVDAAGFPSQILDLTVRCNRLAAPLRGDVPAYEDASFSKFDQFRIYLNPGAADYVSATFLNERKLDAYEIYRTGVVDAQEAAARETLTADMESMMAQLQLIDEYRYRVEEQDDVIVPPAPVEISGDLVVKADDGGYVFTPTYVVPGGYDFDWFHGSVESGYLHGVTPANMTDLQYLTRQREAVAKSAVLPTESLSWIRMDGTTVNLNTSATLSASEVKTQQDIQALIQAWQSYFEMKCQYQTTDLESLLVLEYNAKDVSRNYTVNAADNITLW